METRSLEIVGLDGLLPAGAALLTRATGATWSEGPVWIPEQRSVRWSDIPANRILEYSTVTDELSVYATDVEFTNGRTRDHDGTIIQCSHGNRRVERDDNGVVTSIIDSYRGVRLNSPNDVIVSADGTIWFTDPSYGITVAAEGHPGVKEYGDHYVFRYDRTSGELSAVVIDVEEPNGLAFSPDESVLYVSDTSAASHTGGGGNHHIRAYDMVDGQAKNGRTFAVIPDGVPDGFRVDTAGNLWTSSESGVFVYSNRGELLGAIPVPEKVANLCFGGEDGTELFIAASTTLYSIQTRARDAAISARTRSAVNN